MAQKRPLIFETPKKKYKVLKDIKSDIDPTSLYFLENGQKVILWQGKVDVSEAPEPNQIPEAHAGEDITVKPGDTFRLDGSLSKDPDGTIMMANWRQISPMEGAG